jgi:hypothetical protein
MSNYHRTWVLLVLILAGAGIFVLPWHVQLAHPYLSMSYTYGFNNRVSQLSAAAGIFALFILNLSRGRSGRPLVASAIRGMLDVSNAEGRDPKLFLSFVVVSALTVVTLTGWYCFVPYSRCGEMACFLSRMDLLVMGRIAYYQFPFPYGPALIYLPYLFYKALNGLLSVEQAYFTTLLCQWIAGYYLLYYCVRLLFPTNRRLAVFWLTATTFFNLSLGANYTPLRFLLPLSALLWVHALMIRPRRRAGPVLARALLGPFAAFLISPEIGLAATLALVVYFAALLWTSERRMSWLIIAPLVGMAAAVAPWLTHYIGILSRNPGEFPVLPGPAMLLMLAAAFLVIPSLAAWAIRNRSVAGAAALALCAELGLFIVPAMSRCDIGHVYIYGLGTFLLGFAILARLPGNWSTISAWTVFIVIAVIGSWPHYPWLFRQVQTARIEMRTLPAGDEPMTGAGFRFSKQFPSRTGMEPLLQYGPLSVPLGCDEGVDRFLKLNGKLAAGYYPSYEPDVYNLPETLMQIKSLDWDRTILIPKEALNPAALPPARLAATDSHMLFTLELFPVHLHPRNLPFDPDALVAAAIRKEFVTIGTFRDYDIMSRNSGH